MKNIPTKANLFVASALLAGVVASPVLADPGFTITPSFGYIDTDGDRADDNGAAGLDLDDSLGSIGLGYRFNNPWQLELVYGQGELSDQGADVDYSTVHLDGLYHFGKGVVTPYVAIGAGYSEFDELRLDETNFNLGGGLKFAINKILSVRTDVRAIQDFDDSYTDVIASIGLQFLAGGKSAARPAAAAAVAAPVVQNARLDADGDGVIDSADSCPNTPAGVEVNASGCELDSDGDGIVNSKDECPDSELGAKVDEVGCYIILTESRNVRLDVKFANNSAAVDQNYLGRIEEVAGFMREYPQTNVVIEGHTDDRGKASYNLVLSEERAKNVAALLVSRYNVAPSRVSSVGYGESKPIADNASSAGRAENRRVVAVISATVQKRAQ